MVKQIFRSSTFRWILAIFITLASAVYQRLTGPTYPLKGEVKIEDSTVGYELTRSHVSGINQPIEIIVPDSSITGKLVYRRFPTTDPWTTVAMTRNENKLKGEIPHQPPAGKMEYYILLQRSEQQIQIPDDNGVVTRFKGDVPAAVLAPHVLFMFLAMLLSTKTGIDALDKNRHPRTLALWTFGLLTIGGMILGPIVQQYAFGQLWTGVPLGWDLTDNKTLIAFLVWLVAIWRNRNQHKGNGWYISAAIVTLIIFIIPHSVLGSQLEYQ